MEFDEMVGAEQIACVGTKYKIVDREVRPVAPPLPEHNWERIKGDATDPRLRDPHGIGHRFTEETLRELKIDRVASCSQWRRIGSGECSKVTEGLSLSCRRRSGVLNR